MHLVEYLVSVEMQQTNKERLNMATKKISAVTDVSTLTDKERKELKARAALLPSANAAAVMQAYSAFGEQDINLLKEGLQNKNTSIKDNDMFPCEAMLVGQANALQSIFVKLALRAANQEMLVHYETFLRLALKAQNQSRMTLETLATIKNPPVVFANQANINQGSGNQQVNNGTPAPASHAKKNLNQQNELLEADHGSETMDTRTTGATIGKNPAMATMD